MKCSLFGIPRSCFIESQIRSYAVFYYANRNHVVDGKQDVLSFLLHQRRSLWAVGHVVQWKHNLPSASEEDIKSVIRKSFLDYETFFEKEQLCKGHFRTQANCLEDTKLHHFLFTKTLISLSRVFASTHQNSRASNNFFSSFLAFQQEELYHSQTFSLSFQVVDRKVKTEES